MSQPPMGSGVDDRGTPAWLFKQYNDRYRFTLDAAASHENALANTYCTLDGLFSMSNAGPVQHAGTDGLRTSWQGHTVWINPPYSRGNLAPFVQKAYQSHIAYGTRVVALLPVRTEQDWFHEYVLPHAKIEFIRGRVKFDGLSTAAPFPSMVVVW